MQFSFAEAILKSTLQLYREYDQDTWVVFLDLVKVFDTADHKLLFLLLRKFGFPNNVVRAIENLYANFNMELKIGKKKEIVEYLTGVKQGDVLAPTLFLFPMQAMEECVIRQWEKEKIEPMTYLYNTNNSTGKMIRHKNFN